MFRKLVVLFLIGVPLCSFAFFPPKERSSPAEVLKYRDQKMTEYRAEREKYEQKMIDSRKQVIEEMKTIPWKSSDNRPVGKQVSLSDLYKGEVLKNGKRFPMVIVILIVVNILFIVGIKKSNIFARD